MKRSTSLAMFQVRLRQALIEMQSEFNKWSLFSGAQYKPHSGAHLSKAIYKKFGVELRSATTQRWINGKGFPSEDNWPFLTALVGKSEDWLRGRSEASVVLANFEATQPRAAYANSSPKEHALRLLGELTRLVQDDF
jgi:hypothetical protein